MDTQREVHEILAELEAVLTNTDAGCVLGNVLSAKSIRGSRSAANFSESFPTGVNE